MDGYNEILTKLDRLENIVADLVETVKKQKSQIEASPYVDADLAATTIGIPITPSGTHRRKLSWLNQNGFLTNTVGIRNRHYSREELASVAKLIKSGAIVVPTSI